MPRFNRRSPTLAHSTINKTVTRVLNFSVCSCVILGGLVVSAGGRSSGHGHHRLRRIAPATCPLHALRAQLQELHGFVVQTLPLVAIPERFTNDAPGDAWAEIVLIIKAAHSG